MCTLLQWSCSYTYVHDLHGCASAKTQSPTRRQSVILVVSGGLVMSKMFLQNPYTSSEIVDVSISLSLVVIRLGLIEVSSKWHHIMYILYNYICIVNIHTRVASRYSNDYITTQIETPFYMVMETLEWAPDFLREIQVARMLTDTGLSRKAYEKLEKMFKERDLETGWWHASRILSDWRHPYRT